MKATIVNTICGFEDSTIFEGTRVDVLEIYTKDNRVKVRCPRRFIYVLGLEDVKIENERR
jgi:hypothetical protein|tara:strand:+ start:361 stop:540 length:180 start_codon:yes stop_codon:yes gene_type:complete